MWWHVGTEHQRWFWMLQNTQRRWTYGRLAAFWASYLDGRHCSRGKTILTRFRGLSLCWAPQLLMIFLTSQTNRRWNLLSLCRSVVSNHFRSCFQRRILWRLIFWKICWRSILMTGILWKIVSRIRILQVKLGVEW